MFSNGQRVAYVGSPSDADPALGDEGVIVAVGHTASYVKWQTGERAGSFIETSHLDIAPMAGRVDVDLMGGGLVSFSVRDMHSSRGTQGLLDALNAEGHLANFEEIAMQSAQVASSLIRSDPSMAEVIAQLDQHDADELVSCAVVALFRDAFGRGGD